MALMKNIFQAAKNAALNDVQNIYGAGAPTNGTSGTGVTISGPGSTYVDITNKVVYLNTNTKASPTWTAFGTLSAGIVTNANLASTAVTESVTVPNTFTTASLNTNVIQRATFTITSAAITGTAAGQLGHVNGVVLQATPGANVALQLIAVGLYYTFATAAYTAGGDDVSVRWGSGGAAVTGVVTKANMLGAASSKAAYFLPLTAAATTIVSNASLNLVATTAYTQPGTAAGTVAGEIWYRTLAVGF